MSITPEDFERLDERYITRKECDRSMSDVNKKLAEDSTELAVIKTQLKMIIWLLAAIGSGVLTTLIKLFFGV